MRDERGPGLLPDPVHDVERPLGKAGVVGDVCQDRGGQGRPLRWLHDDRVPGGEGGGDAPGHEHQGRVPRGDHGRHSGGVPLDVVHMAARLDVGLPQLGQLVGESMEVVGDAGHHGAAHRSQQGSVVAGLDGSEVLDALLNALADRVQDLGALVRGSLAPDPGAKRRSFIPPVAVVGPRRAVECVDPALERLLHEVLPHRVAIPQVSEHEPLQHSR